MRVYNQLRIISELKPILGILKLNLNFENNRQTYTETFINLKLITKDKLDTTIPKLQYYMPYKAYIHFYLY